ncbi:hypothetical protein CXG81DRAFT_21169 [Caulochytrium protostelioides]|uniref:Uncharacterized protein n=1 Tax=Caulochytrium protostelioides TaxID=1555241 RepID=A0A4P9X2K7_9FUNG|nr:hypothetical protein CXG81DRAFT_21169 [Caulochytrium protostelioides]|eukprot:RKO98636.1 hypothetical protein CXG81DRAFT_21169 [Caulochytrium protostelioides]
MDNKAEPQYNPYAAGSAPPQGGAPAGGEGDRGYHGYPPQGGYNNSYPPQQQGYGGGYPQQGYGGGYQQPQYQPQYQPPPQQPYKQSSNNGCLTGLLAGLACCCCLDCIF